MKEALAAAIAGSVEVSNICISILLPLVVITLKRRVLAVMKHLAILSVYIYFHN